LGTTFGGASPPKIWEGKKHPKFGAISDNFDRECLRNASKYRQSENGVINYNLSHVWRKKMSGRPGASHTHPAVNLALQSGSLTTELTRVMFTHAPKINFFGRPHFGP